MVGVVVIVAHTVTVSIDDQVVREMPASMGKPRRPTPVGSFVVLKKQRCALSWSIRAPSVSHSMIRRVISSTGVRRPRHVARCIRAFRAVIGGITG